MILNKYLGTIEQLFVCFYVAEHVFRLIYQRKNIFACLNKFSSFKNWNYIGKYPNLDFYEINKMKTDKRKKCLDWYKTVTNTNFDFQKEMSAYCKNDVVVLEKCCSRFQNLFQEITMQNNY